MTVKRILVVDDQQHINRILQRSLTHKGYEVNVSSNGAQALDLLRQESFDVIITDYQMPVMDGVNLCENYRKEFPDNTTLTILSTAVADEKLQSWAESMPDTLYLEKPVSLKRLCDILDNFFARRHESRAGAV